MRLAPLRSTCVYLNDNARYDRPKISHELQVNVPRTMGILRDEGNPIRGSLNTVMQRVANENAACRICKRSDQPKIERLENNDARLLLRRKLNGTIT